MATVFKTFLNDDIATTRTLLHEAIPVHGGILYGTYDEPGEDDAGTNIKNYPHRMFQSVYDYPYLSSSANHIFDLTLGVHSDSTSLDGAADELSLPKKMRIYQQMAQVLVGHDTSGQILKFDEDGNILEGGDKLDEVFIISAARLLNKDEIKKGSCHIHLDVGREWFNADEASQKLTLYISDEGSANDYRVNSPAGDYGILRCRVHEVMEKNDEDEWVPTTSESYGDRPEIDNRCGLVYYQAGVIVLSPSVFEKYHADDNPNGKLIQVGEPDVEETPIMFDDGVETLVARQLLGDKDIPTACDALRKRIDRLAFNNTTELNSTIYFCRVNHNDFNYSSNPTYLQDSKIRVKESTEDAPVSYISTVGLYSADNELLAVAKLSEVLRKDPTNEMVLRVRLDY
jgi:hypothetical protein